MTSSVVFSVSIPRIGSLVLPDNGIANINPLYPRNIPLESATQAGYPDNSLVRFPKTNFYPRAGLAYKLTADGKTAVRAGYGIYGNTIYGSMAQQGVGGPFAGSATLTNVLTNGKPLLTFGILSPRACKERPRRCRMWWACIRISVRPTRNSGT